ncbi:hypothetical protein [Bosea sp. UC22_33]|uniref:hypothetical protein n=1 Tax=Bosea sp. UC22_33 TaxID=3350165 RepID=UPI00366D734A
MSDDYEEDESCQICDCSGKYVAYRAGGFHLYRAGTGAYFGTHGLKPGTSFRANEVFRDGRYVGELRRERLVFDPAKAELRALTYPQPRIAEIDTLLPPIAPAIPMPPGCRNVEFR